MRSTVSTTIGARLLQIIRLIALLPLAHAACLCFPGLLSRVRYRGHARGALLVGDADVVPRFGAEQLIVGIDRESARRGVDAAFWAYPSSLS